MNGYFGKYRGKVEKNVDPEQRGRIQVSVAAVLGKGRASWAEPCVPYGGKGLGFFAVPPEQANVWVEFEGGDPDRPIWSGCFWGRGEAPAKAATTKVFKTDSATITIDDASSSFRIEVEGGMTLEMGAQGIAIRSPRGVITLKGQKGVSINDGALEVS